MTEYEKHKLFYEQFNTVVHNHQLWCESAQGTFEILQDPWKAEPPVVRIESPFQENTAREILEMIRARHASGV
jgi:hypothetical protein